VEQRAEEATTHRRAALSPSMRDHLRSLLDADLDLTATDTGTAAAALARALHAGTVGVAYQPIVALADGRPVAVEALVRPPTDVHPHLGDPAGTIAVAEATGLISALGAYVLAHACTAVTTLRREPGYGDLQVHVNVSPLQLRDERLVPFVHGALAAAALPADALVLEITESAAYEQDGLAEATLAHLNGSGVELAIDDFGTGFASLERLAATPAQSLKLDRSFVQAVGAPDAAPRGRALVAQAAIGLGRSLGLRTVAEGIESRRQARTLEAWGCEFGQGYLFGRPTTGLVLPPVDVAATTPQPRNPRALSAEAVDLALAAAQVVLRTAEGGSARRSAAQELAALLAEHARVDRRQSDLAVVLAVLADADRPLGGSGDRSVAELERALQTAPEVGHDATPAGLARAAARLAAARVDGASAGAAVRTVFGATSSVDPDLLGRLETWWTTPPAESLVTDLLRGPERRLRDRDQAGRRLRSLTTLAQAIGAPGSLEDVLEVTAEEARVALGAASLSISRYERDRVAVRTLVNVGALAPWEERRPHDEVYPLAEFSVAAQLLLDGITHIEAIGSPTTDAQERELLERVGKGSSAAVPILLDGDVWGEVYATTAIDEPPFTSADVPFLVAVANVVSLAVRRTGQVDELARLASEDTLTRLPNRRSLQRWLDGVATSDAGTSICLLFLDVHGLGDINREHGHTEGDRVLVRVAEALLRATIASDGLAARVAGDEFCVGIRGDAAEAISVFEAVRDRLRAGPAPQPRLVCGVAWYGGGPLQTVELLQRADAAQYRARSLGVELLVLDADGREVHRAGNLAPPATPGHRSGGPGSLISGLERWSEQLTVDGRSGALEALGEVALAALDLNRWVVSEAPSDGRRLHVRSVHSRRRRPNPIPFAPLDEEVYELDDYPLTRRALEEEGAFAVDVDDPRADAKERALLEEFGQRYVVALACRADDGTGWLLELYGDTRSAPIHAAIPFIESIASRTLDRPVRLG
jgi:diguanylate cyclase (GGDEF)-like protein